MQITIDVQENAINEVMYLLKNLSDVKIMQKADSEDLSFLEDEIEKGLQSSKSTKTHTQIVDTLKNKYA